MFNKALKDKVLLLVASSDISLWAKL